MSDLDEVPRQAGAGTEFTGRTAIVTGAAGGIGSAIARSLADLGAHLVLVDSSDTVADLAAEIDGVAVRGDVGLPGTVDSTLNSGLRAFGGIDMLVNVAGIQVRGPATNLSSDDWSRLVAVNLTATYRFCQAVADNLRVSRGAIVNISSMSADRAVAGIVPYGAIKSAVSHLTRGLAVELGPSGVRVNAVAPGYVMTAMTADLLDEPNSRKRILERIPLQHLATPEDIAPPVVFLLSRGAAYITGAVLAVDGGYSAT